MSRTTFHPINPSIKQLTGRISGLICTECLVQCCGSLYYDGDPVPNLDLDRDRDPKRIVALFVIKEVTGKIHFRPPLGFPGPFRSPLLLPESSLSRILH